MTLECCTHIHRSSCCLLSPGGLGAMWPQSLAVPAEVTQPVATEIQSMHPSAQQTFVVLQPLDLLTRKRKGSASIEVNLQNSGQKGRRGADSNHCQTLCPLSLGAEHTAQEQCPLGMGLCSHAWCCDRPEPCEPLWKQFLENDLRPGRDTDAGTLLLNRALWGRTGKAWLLGIRGSIRGTWSPCRCPARTSSMGFSGRGRPTLTVFIIEI